jgi:hypothetical protein
MQGGREDVQRMTTVPNLRRCNKCERYWHVSEFYPTSKSKDGLDTWCKTCHFAKKLRQRYLLTPERYHAILEAQGGVCAICKAPPNGKRLAVDHDHACCPGEKTCGECIRGLLCDNCNWWLGLIDDNLSRLEAAEQYLRRYQCTVSDVAETSISTRRQSRELVLTLHA